MAHATKPKTKRPAAGASDERKRLVAQKLQAISVERERIEGSLRQLESEIESLSKLLGEEEPGGQGLAPKSASSNSSAAASMTEQGKVSALADRSKWSPKLCKLIEERYPEATKEERVRRATEKPIVTLDVDLPLDVVKYYAEDADFEYDV
jgi:chromosome segregation ATPase